MLKVCYIAVSVFATTTTTIQFELYIIHNRCCHFKLIWMLKANILSIYNILFILHSVQTISKFKST